MHKADVDVFSDSDVCLGKQATTMPEIKSSPKDGKKASRVLQRHRKDN